MARHDSSYSRFVALAKVVLPLGALLLLATLFLFARRIDPDAAIPFAEVDVEQFAREARIGAPKFSGVTEDGVIVSLIADVARPDLGAPGRMIAEKLSAVFDMHDGSQITAVANTGTVDGPGGRMVLKGAVVITSSTGYTVNAEALDAALDRTSLHSADGPVTADGPPGHLEAGSLEVTRIPDNAGAYVLVFKDGVRLVYRPES